MNQGRSIFRLLVETRDPAADDALLAALKSADLPTAQAIVETLLVRQQRRGLRGLVMALHLLDETLCHRVLGETDRLFGVLREAAQSRDEQVRLNVLDLIREGRLYRASYLLDGTFHDRSSRVREKAAETLLFLAEEILKTDPAVTADEVRIDLPADELQARMALLEAYAEDRRQLAGAVQAALMAYDLHSQPVVIQAAMWMVDDLGAKFWTTMTAPGGRRGQVAMRLFSESLSPRLVPFAMKALHYAQFRPHVAHVLAKCADSAFLEEWLRQSWRFVQPKQARAMSAVKDLACLDHHAMELLRVSPGAQSRIPRWILSMGLPADCKIELLKQLQMHENPLCRRAVVWTLTDWHDAGATEMLRKLAASPDSEVSCIAMRELVRRRPLEYSLSEVLLPGPVAMTAGRSERPAGRPVTFERYWAAFDRLTKEEREQFGQEMLTRTPGAHALLARQLSATEPHNRVRSIRVIELLGLVPAFADQIYRLTHDPQPEVRSSAVAACAKMPNGTTRQIVHNALRDSDTRVQANAVEVAEKTYGEGAGSELLPKLASPNNRVRANAVKALLNLGFREAAETMLRMLIDPDRAQRISALWLIEHMGVFNLTARITRMAAEDEDITVRHRAQSMIERLTEESARRSPARTSSPVPSIPEVAAP
ncbi:MAG: hypothetical protein GXY55_20010 [Phycisphaerae bacterium]|nr:hypothetical protein [Phycisphaerae bacterium]